MNTKLVLVTGKSASNNITDENNEWNILNIDMAFKIQYDYLKHLQTGKGYGSTGVETVKVTIECHDPNVLYQYAANPAKTAKDTNTLTFAILYTSLDFEKATTKVRIVRLEKCSIVYYQEDLTRGDSMHKVYLEILPREVYQNMVDQSTLYGEGNNSGELKIDLLKTGGDLLHPTKKGNKNINF